MTVITKDGRQIKCSRITWGFGPTMNYVRLHFFRTEAGVEYEYDNIAIREVIEIKEE